MDEGLGKDRLAKGSPGSGKGPSFTPGPYRLRMETAGEPEFWPYAIIEGGEESDDPATGFSLRGIMTAPTARLMASAPEMYAFIDVLAHLTQYDIDDDANFTQNGEDAMTALNRLIQAAGTVTAKARGDSSPAARALPNTEEG